MKITLEHVLGVILCINIVLMVMAAFMIQDRNESTSTIAQLFVVNSLIIAANQAFGPKEPPLGHAVRKYLFAAILVLAATLPCARLLGIGS